MSEFTLNSNDPIQQPFTVGQWIIDPARNTLRDRESSEPEQSLEPRLMLLLCYLAANPGRVLTREQLSGVLWPRVIVNENSLTRAVSELRRHLQPKEASRTGFLETIPKKGYRLTVNVGLLPEQVCRPVPDVAVLPVIPNASNRAVTGISALAACLALAVSIPLILPLRSVSTDPLNVEPVQLVDRVIETKSGLSAGQFRLSAIETPRQDMGGPELFQPTLSLDGQTLAYIHREDGRSRIYLRSVSPDAEPVVIFSTTSQLRNLRWSPVGNALLFAREPVDLTPALLFPHNREADLVMLDLETMTVKVLIDNNPGQSETKTGGKTNLT